MNIRETFETGVQHHTAGRLVEAATCYEAVLSVEPRHAEAHSNLGLVLQLRGRLEEAAESFRRAVALKPGYAVAHSNLGNVLRSLGRLHEAAESCRRAIALQPDFAEARNNLGNTLLSLGRREEAVDCYRQAIALKPGYAVSHSNLAFALHALGRPGEAVESYRRAVALQPGFVEAHSNLGMVLLSQGRAEEAAECCGRAIALMPDFAGAHINLGNVLLSQAKLEDAAQSYRRAIALKPDHAEGYNNLGNVLLSQGRLEEAAHHYSRAIALQPGYVDAHMNLSTARFMQGDFEEGWREYEWRWGTPEFQHQKRSYRCPSWDGSMVEMLSIHGEQGVGDQIMFMSLFRQAQRRARNIVIECNPRLVPWFQQAFGVPCYGSHEALINAHGEPDAHIPMGSLPRLLGMPDGKPYMPRTRKPTAGRIGLAWMGGTEKTNRAGRSLKIEQLAPIRALGGLDFVSIQYDGEPDARRVGLIHNVMGRDLEQLNDEIAGCDVIITPCQTAVHQAGSMGVDCWVMVPKRSPWRYGGEKMPWYDAVTYFRQDGTERWEPVIERIVRCLRKRYAASEGPAGATERSPIN